MNVLRGGLRNARHPSSSLSESHDPHDCSSDVIYKLYRVKSFGPQLHVVDVLPWRLIILIKVLFHKTESAVVGTGVFSDVLIPWRSPRRQSKKKKKATGSHL